MEKRSEKNTGVKKIAVIGPESTGKSTLSEQLANYFGTIWIPEYARKYVGELKRKYTLDDIVKISETQHSEIDEKIKEANKFIFVDTEDIINKIWCDIVFRVCPDVIESRITNYPFDFYLLLKPDLPWIADPLREYPDRDKREHLYELYKQELTGRNLPFAEVSGFDEQRFENALKAVSDYFN
jgi:NadR type nicotinamide-nucleotide adenylyltransferase